MHPILILKSLRDELEKSWDQILKSWYILAFQCPVIPEMFLKMSDTGIFDVLVKDKEVREAYKFTYRDKSNYIIIII